MEDISHLLHRFERPFPLEQLQKERIKFVASELAEDLELVREVEVLVMWQLFEKRDADRMRATVLQVKDGRQLVFFTSFCQVRLTLSCKSENIARYTVYMYMYSGLWQIFLEITRISPEKGIELQ